MDFAFSPEQEELRRTVRQFLDKTSPEAEVRRLMETEAGYDKDVWRRMAAELGLQGIAIPERYGGAGYGYLELGIVLQEMGRALMCGPFLATTVLAAGALLEAADEAASREWLPAIAAGDLIATLAIPGSGESGAGSGLPGAEASARPGAEATGLPGAEATGLPGAEATGLPGAEATGLPGAEATGLPGAIAVRAPDTGGWAIDGAAAFVVDGHIADLILVPAATGGGTSLFAVAGHAPGLTRTLQPTFDATRRYARLEFAVTPATLVGPEDDAHRVLGAVFDLAAVALAAEQVGGAERTLAMATDYALLRTQFGRPIGSFQAVKHKLADVLLEVEAARSAAWYGLWTADWRRDELPVVACIAQATCSEAASLAAAENIQVHGGIGYIWEHPAHLYFRRATTSRMWLGDPARHRDRLLARLGC
jgi:alkylation response protein AidB-like acyl-CoA dehydrogenase